ncbi:hypothetical protein CapIbe_004983 [Capra ibex]
MDQVRPPWRASADSRDPEAHLLTSARGSNTSAAPDTVPGSSQVLKTESAGVGRDHPLACRAPQAAGGISSA